MKDFKAGTYVNQKYYKSFQPNHINNEWKMIEDMKTLHLLGQADREIGKLDMYSEYIPNIDLFISMHVVKEATQSSRIEGTQTNIEEALLEKEDIAAEKTDDWEEVQNYISAMHHALGLLHELPFSSRLLKGAHKILLQGVRGQHKQPGEFRTSQNWIGGATINDATFVPSVHTSIQELMDDLEKFVHNEDVYIPELIKIALVHYQFETIHPFLDGNGRVGRLLITLYLVNKGILKKPVLYISDFLEKNRLNYYDNLTRVREKDDLAQWLKFFLVGVTETAKSGIKTFDSILKLQKKVEAQVQALGSRAKNAQKILNYLYQRPIIDVIKIGEVAGLSSASAYKLLSDLEKLGILKERISSRRKRTYSFDEYLKLY